MRKDGTFQEIHVPQSLVRQMNKLPNDIIESIIDFEISINLKHDFNFVPNEATIPENLIDLECIIVN